MGTMKFINHGRVIRSQWFGSITTRRVVIIVCVFTAFVCLGSFEFYTVMHCDSVEVFKTVLSKDGNNIPKVMDPLNGETIPTFRELSSRNCTLENGVVDCPDIHDRGHTLIRQIQLKITRMLIIFDLLCRKHDIKYWLIAGTLLGAVRHGGNIPWDNDADIGMLRSDYEKFLTISHELPSDMFVQNTNTDPHFHVYQSNTAKLRDRNSCYCLCVRYGCKRHDGLMLDIFVYDKSPNTLSRTDKEIYECFYRRNDWLLPLELFPLQEISFEGYMFYAPNKYRSFLQRNYGNISDLPPLSKRCPSKGYIGHPWYSCEEVEQMDKQSKQRVIQESRISNDWILYYVY